MSYVSKYSDIVQLLAESVERFGSKPLFGTRGATGWSWISYSEFGTRVAACRENPRWTKHCLGGCSCLGSAPMSRKDLVPSGDTPSSEAVINSACSGSSSARGSHLLD